MHHSTSDSENQSDLLNLKQNGLILEMNLNHCDKRHRGKTPHQKALKIALNLNRNKQMNKNNILNHRFYK